MLSRAIDKCAVAVVAPGNPSIESIFYVDRYTRVLSTDNRVLYMTLSDRTMIELKWDSEVNV